MSQQYLFTTIIIIFCFGKTLNAQTFIEPIIGISASKVVNDKRANSGPRVFDEKFDQLKLLYGIGVSQKLSSKFLLRLSSQRKKGRTKTGDNHFANDYDLLAINYDYIDVSISSEFQPIDNLSFYLGFTQSILLALEWEEYSGWLPGYTYTSDATAYYEKYHRSIDLGISANYKNLFLRVVYQQGISKIYDTDQLSWLNLNLGYRLRIFKKK